MIRILKLLLPALIPSWNFFDVIAPSPRIQFAVLADRHETISAWCEFRPRPNHVSFMQMLGHMLWNPQWNEYLFMMSCAERLLDQPTQHSENEIFKRIVLQLNQKEVALAGDVYLQFRLMVVCREGTALQQQPEYESSIRAVTDVSALGMPHEP